MRSRDKLAVGTTPCKVPLNEKHGSAASEKTRFNRSPGFCQAFRSNLIESKKPEQKVDLARSTSSSQPSALGQPSVLARLSASAQLLALMQLSVLVQPLAWGQPSASGLPSVLARLSASLQVLVRLWV